MRWCDGVMVWCVMVLFYSVASTVLLLQCRSIHCFTLTPSRKYLDSSSSNSLLHTLHSRQSIGWIPHVIPETPSSNHSHCSCYPCSSHLCSHRVIPHTQVLSLNTHTARVIPDTLTHIPTNSLTHKSSHWLFSHSHYLCSHRVIPHTQVPTNSSHTQVISLNTHTCYPWVFSQSVLIHILTPTLLTHTCYPWYSLTECSHSLSHTVFSQSVLIHILTPTLLHTHVIPVVLSECSHSYSHTTCSLTPTHSHQLTHTLTECSHTTCSPHTCHPWYSLTECSHSTLTHTPYP